MNIGKSSQLVKNGRGHCTTLLEHVFLMRTSCFDTDFAWQIMLTKLPLTLQLYVQPLSAADDVD